MKLTNKTIHYKLKVADANGRMNEIPNSTDIQLPEVEQLTDSMKGAGIMGEIDMPIMGQIGSMTCTINLRAGGAEASVLMRTGLIKIEVVWLNELMDSTQGTTRIQQNKVFMTALNKKHSAGKIEIGAAMDGSAELEVLVFRQIVDGKETLHVDKLNFKYVVNGVDYMSAIRAALQ